MIHFTIWTTKLDYKIVRQIRLEIIVSNNLLKNFPSCKPLHRSNTVLFIISFYEQFNLIQPLKNVICENYKNLMLKKQQGKGKEATKGEKSQF